MGNIKFNASKKTTIILLVVLFFVIGGSGGYLLWRVNQSKTVAPTDSSAGGNMNCNCCPEPDPTNTLPDCYERECKRNKLVCKDTDVCKRWDEGICIRNRCNNNGRPCDSDNYCKICTEYEQDCKWECQEYGRGRLKPGMVECICTARLSKCKDVRKCETKCSKGAQCPPCVWPLVAFCRNGDCECSHFSADDNIYPPLSDEHRCDDTEPRLTCPPGYGEPYVSNNCQPGEKKVSGVGECEPCKNKYTATICCKAQAADPKCGDGEVNRVGEECDPQGSVCTKGGKEGVCDDKCKCLVKEDPPRIEKCDGIGKGTAISFIPSTVKKDGTLNYEYTMRDSKGLDVKSVSVLLNHSSLDVEKNVSPSSGTHTEATVSGKLDTSTVGKHHVLIAWKRPGETSFSEACQIRGNFTVEDVGTPKWDIAKTASEECIVDSDGESIAKLTYTITIKNNGNVTGTITTVTDKLDSKVVDGSVTDISDGGTYSSSDRSIKWGQFDIPAGQTKTLTYSFTVRKDAFGVYDNVVIVKPSDGADYVANASITADCVEEPYQPPVEGGKVPDTGLFDESENLVIMGGILLFLGLGWTWLNRTYQIVNGKLVQRSKERFEQRVVKN